MRGYGHEVIGFHYVTKKLQRIQYYTYRVIILTGNVYFLKKYWIFFFHFKGKYSILYKYSLFDICVKLNILKIVNN